MSEFPVIRFDLVGGFNLGTQLFKKKLCNLIEHVEILELLSPIRKLALFPHLSNLRTWPGNHSLVAIGRFLDAVAHETLGSKVQPRNTIVFKIAYPILVHGFRELLLTHIL